MKRTAVFCLSVLSLSVAMAQKTTITVAAFPAVDDIVKASLQAWQAKHFKAIYATYKNSPWFEHYEDSLSQLYKQQPSLLYQWNNLCINWILKNLKSNATLTDIDDAAKGGTTVQR